MASEMDPASKTLEPQYHMVQDTGEQCALSAGEILQRMEWRGKLSLGIGQS